MPDTGAPWNIPYVEPSDLVRNYPAANELMADAIAAGLTAAESPGIGSNVVFDSVAGTFASTVASFTAVTGLSVSITLSSATSRVLVMHNSDFFRANKANELGELAFFRGGTKVGTEMQTRQTDPDDLFNGSGWFVLDTPGSVGPHTYDVRIKTTNTSYNVSINSAFMMAIEVAP